MVREDAPRRCPRAGSSSRADSAIEERLPLPFRSEVSQPGKIECTAAGHGGACDTAQNPAHAGDRGCGCGVADVGAGFGEGQMDQTWFEMENIRRRKLDKAVWIPLRAYQEDKVGEYEYPGYTCEVSAAGSVARSEEHTSELQSQSNLVCRLLLEKKKK